jgi:hypothetical protein
MCGTPKTQEVVQKTELDPNLQRLLYGGIFQGPQPVASPAPATAGASSSNDGGGSDGGGSDGGGSDGSFSNSFASSNLRSYLPGGINTANPESRLNRTVAAFFESPQQEPTAADRPAQRPSGYGVERDASGQARTVRMAMGGPVMPQMGIASLNQGQMPMMGGQLPNLSDPMTAATLAMAVRNPQMQYGNIMAPPAGFAMGGYIEGPGTGTSDSVDAVIMQNGRPVQEALLSDGEFVMTERAVRGAGGGDREKGAARMYEMMRQFERGGRV